MHNKGGRGPGNAREGSKAKILCISDVKSYDTKVSLTENRGKVITEAKEFKILGFTFSDKPIMAAQVEKIKQSVRSMLWMLTHLGHYGFDADELLKAYTTKILPLQDYCSVVCDPSPTKNKLLTWKDFRLALLRTSTDTNTYTGAC